MICEDNLKRLFEERCEQDATINKLKEAMLNYDIYFYPNADDPLEQNTYRLKKADLIMIEATTKDFMMFLEVVFNAIKDRLIKRERQIILTETKLLEISISRDDKSINKNKLVLKLKDMRTEQEYFIDLRTKYFAYYMSEENNVKNS